jgi:H+/Cl- antiporter ClcA
MFLSLIESFRKENHASLKAWYERLVVLFAAVCVGFLVVGFSKLSNYSIQCFWRYQKVYWWLPLIITPVAGMVIVWFTNRWFSGSKGSGIPQTIAAIDLPKNKSNQISKFISLRIAFGKIFLGSAGLLSGFSAGREGPSVQIGASVMHAFGSLLPKSSTINHKQLILAGAAAGISAAFNTPLAGVVFAIEELGRGLNDKNNSIVITAIVIAGLVSIWLVGNYNYFGSIYISEVSRSIILPVIVCALCCGVLGGIFSKILIHFTTVQEGLISRIRKANPIYWAGFCGLIVAILGVISEGKAHGSGYFYTRQMLDGLISPSWDYAPIKFLATIFTYLSGIPGGIFSPSLSIGAGIGNDLIPLIGGYASVTTIIVMCMAGFLAAATQAPITTFVIVIEMTDGHDLVISLMAVSLLASLVSKLFTKPFYSSLAANFARQ